MGELQLLGSKQLFLSRHCEENQTARFSLSLSEELLVPTEGRMFLDVKECLIPRVLVHVSESELRLNENIKIKIPRMDVAEVRELIETINERLPNDFEPLKFLPANTVHPLSSVKVTLHPGQSIRTSRDLGDLLFENKLFMRNNRQAKISRFTFKIRKDFLASTYYLTCDALESLSVGDAQIPLLNTVSVNYLGKRKHTRLNWDTDDVQEKAFLRPGNFRQLVFSISDRKGEPVRLGAGPLFLQLRICT